MAASATRGVLSGVVAGAGAWVAHTVSGGAVAPLAGLVALVLSVALGPLLLSAPGRVDPVGPRRTAGLMLLAQGVWHLVFLASGDPSHAHGAHAAAGHASALAPAATTHAGMGPAPATSVTSAAADAVGLAGSLPMLGTHLLIAAAATAVAVGLDRSVLRALARIAASLLPRPLTPRFALRAPATPAPVVAENPVLLATARFLVVRFLRGPPAATLSALRG